MSPRPVRPILRCAAPAGLLLLAGCASLGNRTGAPDAGPGGTPPEALLATDSNPFVERPKTTDEAQSGSPPPPAPITLENYFDVLRVQVPTGAVSQSRLIWNHIDEAVLPPETVVQLRRNGFRVGLGRSDSWPPIKAILDAIEGMSAARQNLSFRNPYPLVLEMDDGPRDQTLFLYRANGTLAGATYPDTRNRLRFAHTMNPMRPDEVLVEVTPEVREARTTKRVRSSAHGYELVPENRSRVFGELAARVSVPRDHFLVVGPSEAVSSPTLLGAAFLNRDEDGRRVETILFVTPRVLRNGVRSERPATR